MEDPPDDSSWDVVSAGSEPLTGPREPPLENADPVGDTSSDCPQGTQSTILDASGGAPNPTLQLALPADGEYDTHQTVAAILEGVSTEGLQHDMPAEVTPDTWTQVSQGGPAKVNEGELLSSRWDQQSQSDPGDAISNTQQINAESVEASSKELDEDPLDTYSIVGSDDRFEANQQLAADIKQAQGPPPAILSPTTSLHCNIILVGPPSTGKTTLCRNLASLLGPNPYCSKSQTGASKGEGSSSQGFDHVTADSWDAFKQTPHTMKTSVRTGVENWDVPFTYNVQDTPSLETSSDLEGLLEFLEQPLADHLKLEQDEDRPRPMSQYPDERFDICLYFVGPHSVGKTDISNMASISASVPVVPVLAKADAMTSSELQCLREDVLQKMGEMSQNFGQKIMYEPPAALLSSAGVPVKDMIPPFSVMGSDELDLSLGVVWPVRKYRWGAVSTLSSGNSDMLLLLKLFRDGFSALKASTEERYYVYRRQALRQQRGGGGTPRVGKEPRPQQVQEPGAGQVAGERAPSDELARLSGGQAQAGELPKGPVTGEGLQLDKLPADYAHTLASLAEERARSEGLRSDLFRAVANQAGEKIQADELRSELARTKACRVLENAQSADLRSKLAGTAASLAQEQDKAGAWEAQARGWQAKAALLHEDAARSKVLEAKWAAERSRANQLAVEVQGLQDALDRADAELAMGTGGRRNQGWMTCAAVEEAEESKKQVEKLASEKMALSTELSRATKSLTRQRARKEKLTAELRSLRGY